ncbi:hypothetical protein [Streptosporangium vulgare]|uniref:hypothetical protein n=1 Tax=Streptosporangium vulgare TaxID=46190 RepID=UPI0031DEDF32
MSAWEEIRGLIDRRDADAVAARIAGLDEEARKEVAGRLPGYLKTLRGRRESWERLDDHAEVLRAAGAGVLPGAAAVATWLNRRDFTTRWSPAYGGHRADPDDPRGPAGGVAGRPGGTARAAAPDGG